MRSIHNIVRLVVLTVVVMVSPLMNAQQSAISTAGSGTVTTAGTGTAGVHAESLAAFPDVVFKMGNTSAASLRILNSANSELLRVTTSGGGRVGIGLAAPAAKFHVYNTTVSNLAAVVAQQQISYSANVTAYDQGIVGIVYPVVGSGATNSGNAVGLGGIASLQGQGSIGSVYGIQGEASVLFGQTGSITSAYGIFARVNRNTGTIVNGFGLYIEDVTATNDYAIFQASPDDTNYFVGDTMLGAPGATGTKLTVNGNVNVVGSISGTTVIGAVYQDLAEWVPASTNMEPGTVVVLNRDRNNEVMPSHRAYDTSVAGVVSAQPGILLGVAGDEKEQIATTGRVRVRVDATRAPIAIGDLLVSSDKPGTAMKSVPVELPGIMMHRPGTIIGKALESLASGEGEILVLLSLQ